MDCSPGKGFFVMRCTIRQACLADAESLHRHCYPEARLEDVREYLAWCLRQAEKGWIVRLVAEIEGQAVGNVQLTVWAERGEIGSLIVGQAYRQQGLARRLLTALIDQARQMDLAALELEVSEDQPAIVAFYQRLGFSEPGKKRLSHSASSESVVLLRKVF
jgi:ribosomal protein S18 acetylase RimI-like enzyme